MSERSFRYGYCILRAGFQGSDCGGAFDSGLPGGIAKVSDLGYSAWRNQAKL